MRLPRPYIPFEVRVQVAARQAIAAGVTLRVEIDALPDSLKLRELLREIFGDNYVVQLDHDPALVNRKKIRDPATQEIIGYIPDANDPRCLIYRTKENHNIKTRVRGDGAQLSDLALRRKNKRIVKNRSPTRFKYRWPKRKLRSRVKGSLR